MQYDVEKKVAYFRALLIESFMKEDYARYEYACKGLRQLLDKHSPLPIQHKRKYKKEFNHLTKKGRQYFSQINEKGA